MLSDEDIGNVSLDEIVEKNLEDEKQQIIEENLKKIKFSKSKLHFAQERYYGNKGRSPLTRLNNSTNNETIRPPVHARLGNRTKLRTFPMSIGTDTLMPKTRRILRFGKNDINTRGNSGKILRLFRGGQAQLRIQRIRRQQAEALQNGQHIQPMNKLRLRRKRPNGLQFPMITNYSVQIPNNTFVNQHIEPVGHSIRAELDMDIQEDIERIQILHQHPFESVMGLPQLPSSGITLNERFSTLL